jgi:hypothetical protein
MYVYIGSEPQLWTVGFYAPDGKWISESDHSTRADAARRVHWLNGGGESRPPVTNISPTRDDDNAIQGTEERE